MPTMTAALFVAVVATSTPNCLHKQTTLTPSTKVMTKEFYRDSSTVRRMRHFRQYRVTEQYDLFIYGNQFRHPPAQYLAQCFALNGIEGVDLLRVKLREASDDLTIRDITKLLKEIDAMRMYDVAGDHELMTSLGMQVQHMKDPGWKALVTEMIAKIGHERRNAVGYAPLCRTEAEMR